jgi:hypothetical protein
MLTVREIPLRHCHPVEKPSLDPQASWTPLSGPTFTSQALSRCIAVIPAICVCFLLKTEIAIFYLSLYLPISTGWPQNRCPVHVDLN